MAAWNSFSYICTIVALHSFRYFAHCRSASTVIPLLPKVTFTPSIQPNLGLLRTRPVLTSEIIGLLAIRYSSILYTCPNHLYTLWSALLANSLYITALPHISSFVTLLNNNNNNNNIHSWHSNQTSQTLHLKNIHFPSLSTYTPCLYSVQRRLYNYSFIYRHFFGLNRQFTYAIIYLNLISLQWIHIPFPTNTFSIHKPVRLI